MIARNLVDGKLSEAGTLLSKYKKSSDHAELVSFFAEKPPLVQYELAQVYRKGLGVEVNLEIVLTWYRQGVQRKKKLN
jgi:TPR repeat protein